MAGRGPVPNRSDDLSRKRNANRANRPDLTTGEHLEPKIPEPNPEWGKVTMIIWDSFHNSGQCTWWQETDWSKAYFMCEQIDRHEKNPTARGSAQNLTTIVQMMSNLMMTEAERRRARIELERPRPIEEPIELQAVRDLKSDLGFE